MTDSRTSPNSRRALALTSLVAFGIVVALVLRLRRDVATTPHAAPSLAERAPTPVTPPPPAPARRTQLNLLPPPPDEPVNTALAEEDTDEESAGPLAEMTPTARQNRLLYRAEEAAIATCMKKRGFVYEENPYLADDELDRWAAPAQRGDLEAASMVGYGLSDSLEIANAPLPPSSNDAQLAALSSERRAAWQEALQGPPILPPDETRGDDPAVGSVSVPGGPTVRWNRRSCFASARRALYGDDARFVELRMLRDRLKNEIRASTQEDPEYKQGVERWRACMSQSGLTYDHPRQAAEVLMRAHRDGSLSLSDLRMREVEVAVADATCFKRTGLDVVQENAQARAEASARAANTDELGALRTMHEQSLVSAEQLLGPRSAQQTEPTPPPSDRGPPSSAL